MSCFAVSEADTHVETTKWGGIITTVLPQDG